MITLSISKSPDSNAIGNYPFHRNIISIGMHRGDILIADPLIIDLHLLLEVTPICVVCYKSDRIESYHLNGKKTVNTRELKSGDQLTIGNTEITLLNFSFTPIMSKKDLIGKNLAMIHKEVQWKELRPLLAQLEDQLSQLLES